MSKAGITRAIDKENTWAVQAITTLITKTAMLLITPIWPMTTLAGAAEREFAIFITLGVRNDAPKPDIVKLIDRLTNISI